MAKYIRSWSDYACINSLVVREFQVQRINTRSFISLLEAPRYFLWVGLNPEA